MDVTHLLNRTLQVWRETAVDDGSGGQDVTVGQVAEVPAKVDQPSDSERALAQQTGSAHTHTVYLLPDADVRRGDQLRGGGQVFTVDSVLEPSAPVYRKARCELIQTQE